MKYMKKILALALISVSLLSICLPAMAAYSTMYVNIKPGETVRLRKSPNSNATVLVNVPHGSAIQAEHYNSTWHRAAFKGYSGYMMSKFLSDTNPSTSNNDSWESRYGKITYKKSPKQYELFKNVQRDLNTFFEDNKLTGYAVYPLSVDGIMGDASKVAVMVFQQKALNDIDADGIVGPIVKSNLYRLTQKK